MGSGQQGGGPGHHRQDKMGPWREDEPARRPSTPGSEKSVDLWRDPEAWLDCDDAFHEFHPSEPIEARLSTKDDAPTMPARERLIPQRLSGDGASDVSSIEDAGLLEVPTDWPNTVPKSFIFSVSCVLEVGIILVVETKEILFFIFLHFIH